MQVIKLAEEREVLEPLCRFIEKKALPGSFRWEDKVRTSHYLWKAVILEDWKQFEILWPKVFKSKEDYVFLEMFAEDLDLDVFAGFPAEIRCRLFTKALEYNLRNLTPIRQWHDKVIEFGLGAGGKVGPGRASGLSDGCPRRVRTSG